MDTRSSDYVAGMTDHYAVACYQELFIPRHGIWELARACGKAGCPSHIFDIVKGGPVPCRFPRIFAEL